LGPVIAALTNIVMLDWQYSGLTSRCSAKCASHVVINMKTARKRLGVSVEVHP
jgi:uncharacterized membrane protein YcjF (UPF0283 family)